MSVVRMNGTAEALIYTHINPYGRFDVDLDRRIDFERKAAGASLWVYPPGRDE